MTCPPSDAELAPAGYAAALALREAGRYGEAERALAGTPLDGPAGLEAMACLAHLNLLQGRAAEAQALLDEARGRAPDAAPVRRTEARLQLAAGRTEAAVAAARAAVAAADAGPEDRLVLALALVRGEGHAEAAALAEAILTETPARAEAHLVRGQAAQRRGDLAQAVEAFEAALRLKPHLPLWAALGGLLMTLRREEAACAALEEAVRRNPNDRPALVALATLRERQGRLDAARAAYARAAAADPGDVAAHLNLGRLLAEAGETAAAEASFRRAIALRPDMAIACHGLAGVLMAADRPTEAEAALGQALALKPDFREAELDLASLRLDRGETAEARARLAAVAARDGSLESLLRARLTLPVIVQSRAEIAAERAAFAAGVAEAAARPEELRDPKALASKWFYLAYHGLDDRPLMAALDAMLTARAPQLGYVAPHLAGRAPRGARRLRVGFVSQFLCNHTIGRLYRGFIAGLDRRRFEVVVGHLPQGRRDAARAEIDRTADVVVELAGELPAQREQLAAADLDALIYPDIGMGPASYLLARARLAPVQAAGWGHPDTTGLASLDHFISAHGIEPEGAEAHYAERLVRLDRLPAFYAPLDPPAPRPRAAFGLPEGGRLYGCPQSLFKMHPDFDAVLAGIVERDPQARLVFLHGPHPEWAEALRRRWRATHPEIAAAALFLPRMGADAFQALLASLDVLLDPPHFGSGNTLYEAMAAGAPVVTWEGGFARGRIVAAAYRQMGVGEGLIVDSLADYAARAVAVAGDPAGRAALAPALQAAARAELFADRGALRGLEDFLIAAVAAAERGETLPSGWRNPR